MEVQPIAKLTRGARGAALLLGRLGYLLDGHHHVS
jgi:hypothetical protein